MSDNLRELRERIDENYGAHNSDDGIRKEGAWALGFLAARDDVLTLLDYIAALEEQVEQLQSENASAWLAEMDKRLRDQYDTLDIGEHIAQFETQYGLSSADFMRQWLAGDMADTYDFNYWSALLRYRSG